MKKYIAVAVICGLLVACLGIESFAQELAWQEISRGNSDLKTVLLDAQDPRIIYCGSGNTVFKTEDSAESWQSILTLSGQNKVVNLLFFDLKHKNALYAATSAGLFCSFNQGKNWRRIFRGKNYSESDCTALAILPKGIYLGTKAGLFSSRDKGRSWYKEKSILSNSHILAIAYDIREPDYLYVACSNGVFKTDNGGQNWERVFVSSPVENGAEVRQDSLGDRDEEERFSQIRHIAVNPENLNCLYLATSCGVYQTKDRGKSWELLTSFGLLSQDIRFVLVLPGGGLYVTTKSAVFVFNNERWQELSLRLAAGEIRFLACDSRGDLYAACDKGLFKAMREEPAPAQRENPVAVYFRGESSITEVQQAAIKYAEVEPEKILRWRKECRMRAILPKLTIGIDNSKSTNYEIYTSATTKYVYEGPYDRSNGWDVTLSWELGDLIWSDDQTNIDVRSRLMVELRDDILDEVTKLYFERLRVKAESDNLPLEDRKKRFEKELRLQELTANLDALTGGYFSQNIKLQDPS